MRTKLLKEIRKHLVYKHTPKDKFNEWQFMAKDGSLTFSLSRFKLSRWVGYNDDLCGYLSWFKFCYKGWFKVSYSSIKQFDKSRTVRYNKKRFSSFNSNN